MGAAISFRRFALGWRRGPRWEWILNRVDLELAPGHFFLLSGPSGAGKSTLLDLLTDHFDPLDPAWSQHGSLRLRTAGGRRPRVTALFQQDALWDDLSVVGNVRFAAGGDKDRAGQLLERVGLGEPPARVGELSGGQRKRVALARALASAPDLLILDEPTAGLDRESARQVLAVVHQLWQEAAGRLTVILCTHDLEEGRRVADRELHLPGDGTVHLGAPGETPAAPAGPRRRSWVDPLAPLTGLPLKAAGLLLSLVDLLLALPPQDPWRCLLGGLDRLLALLPFMALAGFMMGGLTVHFVIGNDPLHGAMTTTLLQGTGKVLVSVLLPLLATLLYAAPAVSGALARVGSMARDRQLAAYRALGRSARREVLAPLLWSHLLALPLAVGGAATAALFGAWVADLLGRGTPLAGFIPPFLAHLGGLDIAWALAKSLLSALVVTWVPWHLARGRGLPPQELSRASLNAWVYAALGVILIHGLLLFPQIG